MKKGKGLKNAHCSNSKIGMGDCYGTGVKNPAGKMKEGLGVKPISNKGIKKPPKSLA